MKSHIPNAFCHFSAARFISRLFLVFVCILNERFLLGARGMRSYSQMQLTCMHEKCMHFTHKPLVVKITLPKKNDISKMAFLPRRLIALE